MQGAAAEAGKVAGSAFEYGVTAGITNKLLDTAYKADENPVAGRTRLYLPREAIQGMEEPW